MPFPGTPEVPKEGRQTLWPLGSVFIGRENLQRLRRRVFLSGIVPDVPRLASFCPSAAAPRRRTGLTRAWDIFRDRASSIRLTGFRSKTCSACLKSNTAYRIIEFASET